VCSSDLKIVNLDNPVDPLDAVNLQSLTFNNLQEFTITNLSSSDLLTFTGIGNSAINAQVIGDLSFTLNSGNNTLDAQIVADTIINADINSNAGIIQSKLLMNSAETRANATGITQADRGLSSFDSAQFNATNGWITIKDNGVTLPKLSQIAARSVIGNASLSSANVSEVTFATVVNDGNAVKKSQFGQVGSATGFLRRNTSGNDDNSFTTIESSAAYTGISDNNKLISRDSQGDFAARIGDLAQLKIDNRVAIDTAITATGGYIQLFGYLGQGGVLVQDGTLAADKKTAYWNNQHNFKTIDGNLDAPITCSSVQTLTLTTGGNTTAGTITGRWTLSGTSPNESRLQATYSADLAEYYEGDDEYEVGTVLIFGGNEEVTISTVESDTRVAGVVSNTAAFVMYDACPGYKNLVALQGRVPCKVVGKIQKGDLLTTSSIPGVAIKCTDPKVGIIIGKAIENHDSELQGIIQVAVGRT
jgi:hypothetical protein